MTSSRIPTLQPPAPTPSQLGPSQPEAIARPKNHWVVQMNHRNRTFCFIVILITIAVHTQDQLKNPWYWLVLIAQFLIYPHLLYWRTLHRPNPLRIEIQNTLFDSVVFGFWMVYLKFPLWISFSLLIGSFFNPTAFMGRKGFGRGFLAMGVGVIVAWAIFGMHVSLQSSFYVSLLSVAGILLYLYQVAIGIYDRAVRLHYTREEMRHAEAALQQKLKEIQGLQAQLTEQVIRDPLTGLYNRRYLDPTVAREISRCQREKKPLCMMIMDIDHFKQINDMHGHPVGDDVLKRIASILLDKVRAADVACRFGGEEFVLLLPDMPLTTALNRAEECRSAIEQTHIIVGDIHIQATISIGIACFPEDGASGEALLSCADIALYKAKSTGRNRVIAFNWNTTPL